MISLDMFTLEGVGIYKPSVTYHSTALVELADAHFKSTE